MSGTLNELSYALRTAARRPLVLGAAALSLGLGLSALIALLSIVNALVLRPLPVPEPNQLVVLSTTDHLGQADVFSLPIYEALRAQRELFEDVSAYSGTGIATVQAGSAIVRTGVEVVSGNFYDTVRVRPQVGRLLTTDDDRAGATPVVVISDRFWRRQLGQAATAVGSTLRVEGQPFTVVGITPPAFTGLEVGAHADVTVAVHALLYLLSPIDESALWVNDVVARLRSNVTEEAARTRLLGAWPAVLRSHQPVNLRVDERAQYLRRALVVSSGARGVSSLRALFRSTLYALSALAGCILAISAMSLSAVLLARVAARQDEWDLRMALGATPRRIAALVVYDGLILACTGAATGVALAVALVWYVQRHLPNGAASTYLDLTPDWRLAALVVAATAVTAVATTAIPAVLLARHERRVSSSRNVVQAAPRWAQGLTVLQIGVAVALVACTLMFTETVKNLRDAAKRDLPDTLLAASLIPQPGAPIASEADLSALLRDVNAIPGVRHAALSDYEPAAGGEVLRAESISATSDSAQRLAAVFVAASPELQETIGLRVLHGRWLMASDRHGSPPVAVISVSIAQRLFPGRDAVGQTFRRHHDDGADETLTVVGVFRDTRVFDPYGSTAQQVFVPLSQYPDLGRSPVLIAVCRTPRADMMSALQQSVRRHGRHYAPEVQTLNELLDDLLVREQVLASLAQICAVFAGAVAYLGLGALLSQQVQRRRRELAVRAALGASPSRLAAEVVGRAARLALSGIAVGTGAILWGGWLFHAPSDLTSPRRLAILAALTVATSALVSVSPVRRATGKAILASLTADH